MSTWGLLHLIIQNLDYILGTMAIPSTVMAFIKTSRVKRVGLVLNLLQQPLWVWMAIDLNKYGIFLGVAATTLGNGLGLYQEITGKFPFEDTFKHLRRKISRQQVKYWGNVNQQGIGVRRHAA